MNLRRAIERGDVPGPEIHLTSPYFNGPASGILSEITLSDPEEARAAVRYWAAQGFQWFKVYTHVSRPVLEAIVDEAHKHQARVTGDLQSMSCVDAGRMPASTTSSTHGVRVSATCDQAEPAILETRERTRCFSSSSRHKSR